jgi:2-desacetyl-2-hydroxyethyl bacteriochlorophyllide A dehydrogenase
MMQEINEPELENGYSLIAVKRVGVCGTDLHAYEGTQPYFTYPRILGHEIAAEFIAGDAKGFTPGDALTVIPYLHCGTCRACLEGKTNCCSSLKVAGVHIDGAMVDVFKVSSHLLIKGDGLSLDELALVEPLSIGSHAVDRSSIRAGETALVIGAGPIGIGIIQFLLLKNVDVFVIDANPNRIEFCKAIFPTVHFMHPDENTLSLLQQQTAGQMPHVVFDATGNLNAINKGFAYMSHGGKYILVGLQQKEISFSHPEFHKREAALMSSRNATKKDFENVMNAIRTKQIDPARMITHRLKWKEVTIRFQSLMKPDERVIKAIIE